MLEAVTAHNALEETRDVELIMARRPTNMLLEAVAAHDALAAENEGHHRVDDGA